MMKKPERRPTTFPDPTNTPISVYGAWRKSITRVGVHCSLQEFPSGCCSQNDPNQSFSNWKIISISVWLGCFKIFAEHFNLDPLKPDFRTHTGSHKLLRPSGHKDYLRAGGASPWTVVKGWNILNSFHDPMHVILLGTCRDLYASPLGFWIRRNFFGEGFCLEDKLLQFSLELKEACKREKTLNLRLK